MSHYLQAWKKTFVFKGRARRKEYFTFTIINGLIFNLIYYGFFEKSEAYGLLFLLLLVYIIPIYAVAIRRMHDQNRSGWFFFIPIVGPFFAFVRGTAGTNRFGPDPTLQGHEVFTESMTNGSSKTHPSEPWQCSKCNTRNAVDVTECATCGQKRP